MSDMDPRPNSELGPSGPVSDDAVLAAVARAERIERRHTGVRQIAEHLGWRYSGRATSRLRPPLARLVDSGLLDSAEVPRRKIRSKEWKTTEAGRRHLAAVGPIDLPESPQHRRWRQDRDVALWARDAVRAEALMVVDQAYDLLRDPPASGPLTEGERLRLTRRFEAAMKAHTLARWMCECWTEPTDDARGEDPDSVTQLLPHLPERQRSA
ncbi:MAG: hypothetical protein JSU06_02250 [Actinobacteria bacterium]|nr:hypothetical protein [Actinomycetota bacterium]